jgi:hypothetical protein
MVIVEEEVWIIVSKDRKTIAKGVPRNRYLCDIDDKKDKKRILTYKSKCRAESAFKDCWFYSSKKYKKEDLEAVKCILTMTETQ